MTLETGQSSEARATDSAPLTQSPPAFVDMHQSSIQPSNNDIAPVDLPRLKVQPLPNNDRDLAPFAPKFVQPVSNVSETINVPVSKSIVALKLEIATTAMTPAQSSATTTTMASSSEHQSHEVPFSPQAVTAETLASFATPAATPAVAQDVSHPATTAVPEATQPLHQTTTAATAISTSPKPVESNVSGSLLLPIV